MDQETRQVLERLLQRHGTTFSAELGIDLAEETPSALFRWLCAALLMSARISREAALSAARALTEAGWTTAERMAESAWEDRVAVLNRAGYARYDESTARMLGDTAERLLEAHGGDLRELRAAAGRDPAEERRRLKDFKGIGDVGADIFLRDLQTVWEEHFPLLDARARAGAARLGLPEDAETLADWSGRESFPALVTALLRAELDDLAREDLLGGAEAKTR